MFPSLPQSDQDYYFFSLKNSISRKSTKYNTKSNMEKIIVPNTHTTFLFASKKVVCEYITWDIKQTIGKIQVVFLRNRNQIKFLYSTSKNDPLTQLYISRIIINSNGWEKKLKAPTGPHKSFLNKAVNCQKVFCFHSYQITIFALVCVNLFINKISFMWLGLQLITYIKCFTLGRNDGHTECQP